MNKKKTFALEFDKGVDNDFKVWTREAVQDFINLFPEFKDNFQINQDQSYYTRQEVEDIAARSSDVSREDVFSMFVPQSNGSYLKKESLDYDLQQVSQNGRLDLQKFSSFRTPPGTSFTIDAPVTVSIISLPTTFAYGISDQKDLYVSAAQCGKNKDYFKQIIMHELGHVFRATHENRRNNVENLGSHCTDKDCLMYEHAYTAASFNRRQTLAKANPFCNDCMESMRDYMENTLKLQRSNSHSIEVEHSSEPLQDEETEDRSFKSGIRQVFKAAAQKEGAVYKENIQAKIYSATLTHADGSVDKIQAANPSKVYLSSIDASGQDKIPEMERFNNIAEYAFQQGKTISFGNIKSPEFKARLMIACQNHRPPVKMKGMPELDNQFLNKLSPETKKKLQSNNSQSAAALQQKINSQGW